MIAVKELVEYGMIGLDRCLGHSPQEAPALGEVNSMQHHVQLRERLDLCLRHPVLLDVIHHTMPFLDISREPVLGVQQEMVQIH